MFAQHAKQLRIVLVFAKSEIGNAIKLSVEGRSVQACDS